MRHGDKVNNLGRTASHRHAMMSNMASSLILHKRITTTTTKAKELRKYVEPLITKAKTDTTHSRRIVFSYLKQGPAVKELFSTVVAKVGERPGGYTRIMKLMPRKGDNAEIAIIELVDFNEAMLSLKPGKAAAKKTRRGRPKKSEATAETTETTSEN